MNTNLTILALLYCCINIVYAQKKRNTYFFKNNGREVIFKDSADFIRIIEEPDSGSVNFKFYEFYMSSKIKRAGEVSSFSPKLVFEGGLVSYYPNGKREEYSTYQKGKIVGPSVYYYSNGKPERTIEYITSEPGSASKYRLCSYADSLGNIQVSEGKGYFSSHDAETNIGEEGNYENGLKDGIWKGSMNGSSFEEIYDSGQFVSGIATWEDGSKHSYAELEEIPSFKGGMAAFASFVDNNYLYPAEARKAGVRGRVIVSFVVDKDGSISDIKVLRDLGYGTGDEAVRLILGSAKWIPGKQHGIPVRVAYTLPIMLNR